jgi:hypothetical protein
VRPSVTSPARADGRGGARWCCRGWGRCRAGLPRRTPPGRLQQGDDASGSGSGLWPCSSTVDVRRWCGSRVHTRFASFSGLDVDEQVLPEPLRRAPVTAAPTGNGTARHGPEQGPHRLVRSCPARPGRELGALRGDGSATGNTPPGNARRALPGSATTPLRASRDAGRGRFRLLSASARPGRAEGSGTRKHTPSRSALFHAVPPCRAEQRAGRSGTVAGRADCSAGRAEQPPRNGQPFRNSGPERAEQFRPFPPRPVAPTTGAGSIERCRW